MPLSPFSHIFAAVFSSVTMSLLGRTQGNIWLFEDSVLITGKTSGTANASYVLLLPRSFSLQLLIIMFSLICRCLVAARRPVS